METKDIIYDLRSKINMSQEELAQKVFVTRQAVSRWETGETVPNTETLKLLSNLFNVSINTLLGSSRELRCQCCGKPIDDGIMSREPDGEFNEEFCKWCYSDGKYTYSDMNTLIDFCSEHMANESFSAEQARQYLTAMLPGLKYWREKIAEQKNK
ncbi:MAG: zinc ribbon domain-containing protein [Oscillospiraceae bacterium]|nr:zinc ribbon domain-containing protein [Oscillospiraceae bacterium]